VQLSTPVLAFGKRRIQARCRHEVKRMAKFVRKGIPFQQTESGSFRKGRLRTTIIFTLAQVFIEGEGVWSVKSFLRTSHG
jgi:hypothetical protein